MTITLDAATRDALRREIDRRRRIACKLTRFSSAESPVERAVVAVLSDQGDRWVTAKQLAEFTGYSARKVAAALRKLNVRGRAEVRYRTRTSPSVWRLKS